MHVRAFLCLCLYLCLCLCVSLASPTRAAAVTKFSAGERVNGTAQFCQAGKLNRVTYSVKYGDVEGQVFDLDHINDLESVSCDIDGSSLQMKFHNELVATSWAVKLAVDNAYLSGGTHWNCQAQPKGVTGVIVRRVLSPGQAGQYLNLRTSFAKYDEIYEEADIDYASEPHASCRLAEGKQICLGFNTDCDGSATQPLPLYSNNLMTVTCVECFAGHEADIFLKIKIGGWKLESLQAGYKNMVNSHAMVLDIQTHANANLGYDNTTYIAQNDQLVSFKVGPIPFRVSLDMPVHFTANLATEVQAEATFGATSIWNIGDHYVQWDPKNHWTHVKPTPVLVSNTTIRNVSAEASASLTLSVAPSIAMHVDNLFTYRVSLTPTILGDLTWDSSSEQACAELNYDLEIDAETELAISIPFANIHDDWVWDKHIFGSGPQPLAKKCVKV